MKDLSVIIPARNEEYLQNTIEDVLKNKRANTEVIAILDGYWPEDGLKQMDELTIIHHCDSIGQRAAVNEGANLSEAKYLMKLDAHCSVDEGFDVKLMEDCEYDWTVIPRMYNLHVFNWKCSQCGKSQYMGPYPDSCRKCDNTKDFTNELVWKRRMSRKSDFMRFDNNMKFQYWSSYSKREEAKEDIADLMSSIGACFFMHRKRFFDIGGLDEKHGSWGQFGTEIACKSWLSGGRHVVNKKTWFAHMFRTRKDFSFPYKQSGRQVDNARKHSKHLWLEDNWPKATRKLSWLIEHFAPVPDWPEEVKEIESIKVINKFSGKEVKESEPQEKKLTTNSLIYYTDNRCEERIAKAVRGQLMRCWVEKDIISISHLPIAFGQNIVFDGPRSILSQNEQILLGLERSTSNIVFFAEHDILYSMSHFDFIPEDENIFYYNQNRWPVRSEDGQANFYLTKALSHCCVYREIAIKCFKERIKYMKSIGGYKSDMGHSPGTRKDMYGEYKTEVWMSKVPNIDIRHSSNYTKNRFDLKQFRREPRQWKLTDAVPHWGKTLGRFDEFLDEVISGEIYSRQQRR